MSMEKLRQNIIVYWKTAHPTLQLTEEAETALLLAVVLALKKLGSQSSKVAVTSLEQKITPDIVESCAYEILQSLKPAA